jgi:hypothetical protein
MLISSHVEDHPLSTARTYLFNTYMSRGSIPHSLCENSGREQPHSHLVTILSHEIFVGVTTINTRLQMVCTFIDTLCKYTTWLCGALDVIGRLLIAMAGRL